ncbi:trypsin-like peptidase domain-containing protein [Pseudonocardia sp. DSM 110487]|uniref:S1C family serine protease n=1 Tax=Pseudonocardia sp. DSM 110487 TaxID=2865833 RepID=UPI001C6A6C2E|nr:trypsin-like peptidase domain-containing protein [Pseudonocardia sp. DSM 110487]QYN36756.1 trypsin-like peptidase domain-containing protein [Pseudonocardia sp. DSM 110487]
MSDPNTPAEPSSVERGNGAEGPGEDRTIEIPRQSDAADATQSDATESDVTQSDVTPPRLGPRPLERPAVDDESAAAFGRPQGVDGGFAAMRNGAAPRSTTLVAPPPAALASAFGRPDPAAPSLQRPTENGAGNGAVQEDSFWSDGAERDPWRDPESAAALGPPAGASKGASEPLRGEGARLSLREVLFGRRVEPRALALLAVVALLVGAAGGMVGRYTAEGAAGLTDPDPSITQTVPGRERPPGSVADIAARTVPAVVSFEIRVGEEGGTGSGVVIDPSGYVLTNNHVVAPAAEVTGAQIEAIFHDGTRAAAQIVGRDPKTDLAVVKVEVANPVVATFGSSAGLVVGDGVIAIGSPLGLVGTVTEGIVSAVNRPVRLDGAGTDTNAVIDAIQTDAAINPGNSGGPLVDSTGAVVGINTAIRSIGMGEGGSIGLGFAIPIDDARGIAEELIRTGAVTHAEIGVNSRSMTDGTTDGAQVQNVQQGGAAEAAGIIEGDVITRVGDRSIAGADELVVAVRERNPGDTVEVQLIREGRPLTVSVVLASD